MLRNISKIAACTLVALAAVIAMNSSSAEAGGYGGGYSGGGGYHAGGGYKGGRGYRGRRGYRRGYGYKPQYVYQKPCYEKVVIDYKIVEEPYTEYVYVVDDYGCKHRVLKTFYREVKVPVKRIVKVCP